MGAIECTVATAAAVAHGVFLWRGYHALASGAQQVGEVSSAIPFLFPVLYVASVYAGNALMAGRKEMSCKASMAIYNLYAAGLSIVMAYLLGREVLERGLSTFTARGTTPALTAAIWVHYHSKFIEYMDTLFMVLRKKKEQITTLHVVHHAEMAPLTWWWMHTGACNNAFGPAINSVIHTAMYGYYGLTGMGIKLRWFAPYMTSAQLVQFVVILFQALFHIVHWDVYWPSSMAIAQLLLMIQMLYMFSSFFVSKYRGAKKEAGKAA